MTLGSKCERENFEEDTIIDEIIIFIHISSSDAFYFAEKGKVEKKWWGQGFDFELNEKGKSPKVYKD